MDALGQKMAARKEELLAQIKAGGLPPPETRTFKDSQLEQGAPVDEAGSETQPEGGRPAAR